MDESRVYTKEETSRMRGERRASGSVSCPRCDVPLVLAKDVKPTGTVSYVRRREWWMCATCGRSVVLDP